MTDTVNVPREALWQAMSVIDDLATHHPFHGSHNYYQLSDAMLAAAPKAEPVPCVSCEGKPAPENNLCRSCGAEAPKVEQEPVAWLLVNGKANSEVITREHPGEWPNAHVYPLYRHPAPASDELLEAIDMDDFNIIGEWIEGCEKGSAPSGRVKGLWQSMRRVIDIAKHKGPQS